MKQRLLAAACLTLFAGSCGGAAPVPPVGTPSMAESHGTQHMPFVEVSVASADVHEPPSVAVHDVIGTAVARKRPSADAGTGAVTRIGYDTGNMSRAPVGLPAQGWIPGRAAALNPNLVPTLVLATRERAVVIAADRASLYSSNGEELATSMRGAGNPILVPEKDVLLLPTPLGDIQARALDNGKATFLISGAFGDTQTRPYLAWEGSRLLITGQKVLSPIERKTKGGARPQIVLQVEELPAEIAASDDYFSGALSSRTITRESNDLHAAIAADTLVLATANLLYAFDLKLNVRAVVHGEFRTLSMSADEEGRLYLVVQAPTGNELWVLTMDGARTLRVPLPPPRAGGYTPPIIGYDHTIMVPADRRIVVINPEGRHVADYPISENFAGAVTTADDKLLVADGSKLVAYERDGRAQVVADLGDEIIRTAPALLGDGTAWLATSQHLFRLVPVP